MSVFETGMPSSVGARTAEYRVDAAGGVMYRTYGLVVTGGVALLTILTMPKHWPNVVSMVPAVVFLALLAGPTIWLWRSLAAHQRRMRLMREAAQGGPWAQARVLDAHASYAGRIKGRWSFQRTRLRLGFTDPNTGQPRDAGIELYLHPDEHIVSGQVIWVRCHPTLPEPIFVPVHG
jgi:hypothetical protein